MRNSVLNPTSVPPASAVLLVSVLLLTGCASLVSSVTSGIADDLATTILNSNDVDTVREGVPAYLLMIDSFLEGSPDDPDLLVAAANLNGAFSVFTDGERSRLLTTKALGYAERAACLDVEGLCDIRTVAYKSFQARIADLRRADLAVAYALGAAWTGWIQANSDNWRAIGELGKVKLLMSRLVELDERWEQGGPHLYLGGLETALPDAMGGNIEKGRRHFERAIELSDGRHLMTKVIFAEQYARLSFDKALHDRLLREVLAADPDVPGLTLINVVAQRRAQALLEQSDEYF